MKLHNVLFPQPDGINEPLSSELWDIRLADGVVESIAPARKVDHEALEDDGEISSHLLLPTLCHPHLHLDKAYLLTSGCCGAGDDADKDGHVDYSDLFPQTGSFAEALETTLVAKTRFTAADLRRRGLQLLATSYAQGVTAARVFVEVDDQAAGRGTVAVDVARELKTLFKGRLDVQVCAFAQEVLFTGDAGTANQAAMEAVLEANQKEDETRTIAALGVTPYVEASRDQSLKNIDWAVTTALKYDLHLDLHLDYNLKEYKGDGGAEDAANEPLIFSLLEALVKHNWKDHAKARTVVVGHATQLTCLPPAQLTRLAGIIQDNVLPVFFVGLPTSDLYMMGRQPTSTHIPRGTLPIPTLIRDYGLQACLGANNVGNAFTPYGTGDPLQLACLGVGLYHAGTGSDAQLLYGAVSWRAREAIGMARSEDVDWEKPVGCEELLGKKAGPLLAIANPRYIRLPPAVGAALGTDSALDNIPARPRLGFWNVVWDTPDVFLRKVV
ncbi:hypothetical protein Sste5346_003277 [Sporothrix stenoceras]|uniref:Zinc metallopeptidase n=1 Tax=Sporothrix stenoceras TaxID=5173 RepID=A0ABR3ZDX5_9PEZI